MDGGWKWEKYVLGALGALGTVLIALTQVSYTQATSNLGSWTKAFGHNSLNGPNVDTWGFWVGIALILFSGGLAAVHFARLRHVQDPLKQQGHSLKETPETAIAAAIREHTTALRNQRWSDAISFATHVGNFGGRRSWGAFKTTFDAEAQHNEEQLLKLRRGELPPQVERWLLPELAAEIFAHPDMTAKKSTLRDRIRAAHLRAKEAEEEIQILGKAGAYNPTAPADMQAKLVDWRAKLSEASYDGDNAKSAFDNTWNALRAGVEEGLFDGKYVAKGFHHPDDKDGEVAIGKERWRVLTLDFAAAIAKRKADASLAYTGVLIGKIGDDSEEKEK
jgi:hypothetical protein